MAIDKRSWKEEGTNLVRGIGGGVIVAMPVVYTMELWFIGLYLSGWYMLALVLLGLLTNMGLNHASGFGQSHGPWSDAGQAVVALAEGAVLSAVLLYLLGSIRAGQSWSAALGMITVMAVPVSLGVSIANTQFRGKTRTGGEQEEQLPGSAGEDVELRKAKLDLQDIGITIAGAVIFVFGVAPIEEVELIAARTRGFQWAGLVIVSVLITYGMVFVADFAGHKTRRRPDGYLQRPVPETLLAYSTSVIVGIVLMYVLGRTEVFSSWSYLTANAAVIGLPASVGGAAGRLVV